MQVSASALLPLNAHQVFTLITHPQNEKVRWRERLTLPLHAYLHCARFCIRTASRHWTACSCTTPCPPAQIFRHLQACTHHQVLHEEPAAGRRVVESEHVARWRLLALSGTLQTRQANGTLLALLMCWAA